MLEFCLSVWMYICRSVCVCFSFSLCFTLLTLPPSFLLPPHTPLLTKQVLFFNPRRFQVHVFFTHNNNYGVSHMGFSAAPFSRQLLYSLFFFTLAVVCFLSEVFSLLLAVVSLFLPLFSAFLVSSAFCPKSSLKQTWERRERDERVVWRHAEQSLVAGRQVRRWMSRAWRGELCTDVAGGTGGASRGKRGKETNWLVEEWNGNIGCGR